MPRGIYPEIFFKDPSVKKSLVDIWRYIDLYTLEWFEDEDPAKYEPALDLFVILPPLFYEGVFIKGLFASQGVDILLNEIPQLPTLFHSIGNSMWSSHSWSLNADATFSCYPNAKRSEWFYKENPEHSNRIIIPAAVGADFTDEYVIAPQPVPEKDIDILCISRLNPIKNIPFVAEALKIYRKKYPPPNIYMTLIVGKNFDENLEGLDRVEKGELKAVEDILGKTSDYINLVPKADFYKELPTYYSRSRSFLLASLIEGKNRTLSEAMSSNIPVICFDAFNQYTRGDAPAFPEGAGEYAPFDPEGLADSIHHVLHHSEKYTPRKRYLQNSGRWRFFNTCVDSFPYYEKSLPDYQRGNHFHNVWLDLAVQAQYQMSLHEYIYSQTVNRCRARGLKGIRDLFRLYFKRFHIPL
jgi:glycosyltransferase involved in cell wall biosynthesis